MKRHINKIGIFLALILVLSLAGCKKKNPEDTNKPIDKPETPVDDVVETEENRDKLMGEFNEKLKTNQPEEVLDFIKKNLGKVTTIEGDKMVAGLEEVLENNKDDFTSRLMELDKDGKLMEAGQGQLYFPKEAIKDIKDKKLKEEVEKLYDRGYKLISLEGQYYPLVDYEGFKDYYKALSEEYKDYYDIKARESNQVLAIDGGLYIGFDELADRIIQVEKYIQRYGGGAKYEDSLDKYRDLLGIYMTGLPNTPIADHETGEIHKEVLKSYMNTAKIDNKISSHIINKYIEAIGENKGLIDEKILERAADLVDEAVSLLGSSK